MMLGDVLMNFVKELIETKSVSRNTKTKSVKSIRTNERQ